ncbi:MAG: lipocalin family protein [Flavobacteriaceae bacterium]|nr:lipocalin family protein [Flavobacteriaceae bacterium]
MKKILLFLLIIASAVSISSCSDDDDSPDNDSIVGQWHLSQILLNGIPLPLELAPCELQGVLEFKSNGTFTIETFEENELGECVLDEIETGTWVNKGDNVYAITIDGETEEATVTFEGNTFYLTETEDGTTIKIVYKRA